MQYPNVPRHISCCNCYILSMILTIHLITHLTNANEISHDRSKLHVVSEFLQTWAGQWCDDSCTTKWLLISLSVHLRAEILTFVENLNLVLKKDGCLQRQNWWNLWCDEIGGSRSPELRKKISKNHQISIFDFQCVSMKIEGWLKDFTPHLVYSQIWLNLPRDDPHFFYTFSIGWSPLRLHKEIPKQRQCGWNQNWCPN